MLVILVMRVVNIGRYKDLLAIVGGIVLILASLLMSALLQKMPEDPRAREQFIAEQAGLVKLIGSRFPAGSMGY